MIYKIDLNRHCIRDIRISTHVRLTENQVAALQEFPALDDEGPRLFPVMYRKRGLFNRGWVWISPISNETPRAIDLTLSYDTHEARAVPGVPSLSVLSKLIDGWEGEVDYDARVTFEFKDTAVNFAIVLPLLVSQSNTSSFDTVAGIHLQKHVDQKIDYEVFLDAGSTSGKSMVMVTFAGTDRVADMVNDVVARSANLCAMFAVANSRGTNDET